MPKLLKECRDVKEFEELRTSGPNAGVKAKNAVTYTQPEVAEKTSRRRQKWAHMMSSWNNFHRSKQVKVKTRVRKGIPDEDRRSAWNRLVQVNSFIARFPALYENLSEMEPTEERVKSAFRNIELDLYRTFPERDEFKKGTVQGEQTIEKMRRVLRAYAIFDVEVGYCQSMNFLAGTLLMYLPERESFWHLVVIMQRESSSLRGMYRPGMEQTLLMLTTLTNLIRLHLPVLAQHWEDIGVDPSMFATEWYLSLFTRTFPLALTARVIECFLSEGIKVNCFSFSLSLSCNIS